MRRGAGGQRLSAMADQQGRRWRARERDRGDRRQHAGAAARLRCRTAHHPAGVDVDRRGRDGRARPVRPAGVNLGAWHFGTAGGADGVVLPALRVLAGVGGLRAVCRRRRGCVRGRALGVGDGRRVVGGQPGLMSGFVEPVSLTGQRWVSLEPLARDHIPEIAEAASDGELGRLWFTHAPMAEAPEKWVEMRLAAQKPDEGLTFVVRSLDGTFLGSSSYLNVDAANRRLEIGNTWYVAAARRSGVNAETKLLMLGHAFEELGCVAVEFRTHFFNFTSRAAIERLGAKLDGVLRSHQVLPDGSRRDTVVYSILDIEWPAVRSNLRYRLERNG